MDHPKDKRISPARQEKLFDSPYADLVARSFGRGEAEPYYVLELADYVCAIALDERGRLILVRQFRPAVCGLTCELPAGTVEPGEDPAAAALRELAEETGYEASEALSLGWLYPDTGRLDNRQWYFFVQDARPAPGGGERGIEVVLAEPGPVADVCERHAMRHALHMAGLHMAIQRGLMPPQYGRRDG